MDKSSSIRRKPNLLIIGHAQHGKDTVAELISEKFNLQFSSSSMFCAEKFLWDNWGKERYDSFEEFYSDRSNNRTVWGNLISAWNTPDKCRTARTMLEEGNNMYVGMRRKDELNACIKAKLFDMIIWVDASIRKPLESVESMRLSMQDSTYIIDNNKSKDELNKTINRLQSTLHADGFDVNYQTEKQEEPTLNWMDKPVNAIQVLDHGFFEVKEVMGSDKTIADSARMSYGRGTKKVNNDAGLINYLVHNHHTSPLEMGEIRFHMRLPIFVMRQLVRHRTANLNEYSGRYSEMVELFYVPNLEQIKKQEKVNKQGSGDPLPDSIARAVQGRIEDTSSNAFAEYQALLRDGVSRETARMVLPLNTYTECVWKLDVSNLIKFLYLRDDDHAQWEIRQYAIRIAEAVEHFFPLVYAAYKRERDSICLTENQITSLISHNFVDMSVSETAVVNSLLDKHLK